MQDPNPPPLRRRDLVALSRESVDACITCVKANEIRISKAGKLWSLGGWICSAILFSLVGAAVLLGDPVSSKVAEVTGLKALVQKGKIDKEADPGWRAICVAAIGFHGLALFFAKRSVEALEAERTSKILVQTRDKLLAALNKLNFDIEQLERDPQEVARDLKELIDQHAIFFRNLQVPKPAT